MNYYCPSHCISCREKIKYFEFELPDEIEYDYFIEKLYLDHCVDCRKLKLDLDKEEEKINHVKLKMQLLKNEMKYEKFKLKNAVNDEWEIYCKLYSTKKN